MTIAQICILLAIAVYLLAMLGVGVWFANKNRSVDDFYLGGRKLGPFVTAMSAEASDMSSWLLMGLPGVAYLTGLAEAGWTALGLVIGTYLNWLIVAGGSAAIPTAWGPSPCRSFSPSGGEMTAICSPPLRPWSSLCSSYRIPPPAFPPAASCSIPYLEWTM